MIERAAKVQEAIDKISTKAFNNTQKRANNRAECICCGGWIMGFKDEVSVREYHITGMCQACQDKVYEDTKESK